MKSRTAEYSALQFSPSRGFTLIEVLLTTVLAAALLSALWTLLSMHVKLFDAGQTKTEQSQLARTLMKQISDDLHSVVQPPPPVPPISPPAGQPMVAAAPPATSSSQSTSGNSSQNSSANTPSPRPPAAANAPPQSTPTPPAAQPPQPGASPPAAGQPNVASAPAPAANSSSGSSSSSSKSGSNSSSQSKSAASMAPNANSMRGGLKPVSVTSSLRPAGLIGTETSLQIDVLQSTIARDEVEPDMRRPGAEVRSRVDDLRTIIYSFEEIRDPNHPLDEPRTALVRREMDWEEAHPTGAGRARVPAALGGGTSGMTDVSAPLEPDAEGASDDSSETAPEVLQFGIRYFDGSQWSLEWDSAARKGLPVAVEVAMQLRSFDEPEPNHQPTAETAIEDPELTQPKMPTYRLVIHLPSGVQKPGGVREGSGTSGLRGAKPPLGADSRGSRKK